MSTKVVKIRNTYNTFYIYNNSRSYHNVRDLFIQMVEKFKVSQKSLWTPPILEFTETCML